MRSILYDEYSSGIWWYSFGGVRAVGHISYLITLSPFPAPHLSASIVAFRRWTRYGTIAARHHGRRHRWHRRRYHYYEFSPTPTPTEDQGRFEAARVRHHEPRRVAGEFSFVLRAPQLRPQPPDQELQHCEIPHHPLQCCQGSQAATQRSATAGNWTVA